MKQLSRILLMVALAAAFMLATAAWVGATSTRATPTPQHVPVVTPGPAPTVAVRRAMLTIGVPLLAAATSAEAMQSDPIGGMSATTIGLLGLSGYALIVLLCGLLVVEELGVPLPFLPGDLMLVLAGISIATGHLNPSLVMAATYISVLAGALAGREIFERLGMAALTRLTKLLHVSEQFDSLAARLRRYGAPGVFIGRITPGLRVHTTEVSGLIRMPRFTFLLGLGPAVAVYEAVFLGLGAWLGPTAWATIHHYAPAPGDVLLMLITIVGWVFAGRALINWVHGVRRGAQTRIFRRISVLTPSKVASAVQP
jgi:membrane-associated protein